MARGVNGAPQLSWANIMLTVAVMLTIAGGSWLLFNSQFASLLQQFKDADTVIRADVKEIRDELEKLKNQDEPRREIVEVIKRVDEEITNMKGQLRTLEATRPTSETLQAQTQALRERIDGLRDDLRQIEARQQVRPTEATVNQAHSNLQKQIEQLYSLYVALQLQLQQQPAVHSQPSR